MFVSGVGSKVERFFAVTWECVHAESSLDEPSKLLAAQIREGFPALKMGTPREDP
jgi:hypothetical protein